MRSSIDAGEGKVLLTSVLHVSRTIVRGKDWTADDDERLKAAVREHNPENIKWQQIAKDLGNRCRKECRKRWLGFLAEDKVCLSPDQDVCAPGLVFGSSLV